MSYAYSWSYFHLLLFMTPQAALLNLQSLCRKRLKKAVAIVDGESLEEPGNELEDSDVSSDEDTGFVATDEDDVSGKSNPTPLDFLLECHESALVLGSSAFSMACCRNRSLASSDYCDPETAGSLPMLLGLRPSVYTFYLYGVLITWPAAGSELSQDADVDDALGEWDDAEDELYAARLSRWESRQHLVTAADVVPGQVRFACPSLRRDIKACITL